MPAVRDRHSVGRAIPDPCGVGFHHARSGNYRGALLLLSDGIAKTAAFVPICRGIDTAKLVREAQACLDRLRALGPEGMGEFDWETVPVIEAVGSEPALRDRSTSSTSRLLWSALSCVKPGQARVASRARSGSGAVG